MPTKSYLILKRHLDVPPEVAYRAWCDPEQLKNWWGPDEMDENFISDIDVRVGGNYHIVTNAPNGDQYDFSGEYREIVPNKKISFTWDTGDEHAGSIVTAELKKEGTGTELKLTHEGLSNDKERDNCKHGWEGALDKLERLMTD